MASTLSCMCVQIVKIGYVDMEPHLEFIQRPWSSHRTACEEGVVVVPRGTHGLHIEVPVGVALAC